MGKRKKYHAYFRRKIYMPSEIYPLIPNVQIFRELQKQKFISVSPPSYQLLDGIWVKMSSVRLQAHRKHNKCQNCGLETQFIVLEATRHKSMKDRDFHLNFYGYDDNGYERMLTADHIIPKSKGGLDDADNVQVLCSRCNSLKGNTLPEEMILYSDEGKIVCWNGHAVQCVHSL